MRDVLDKIFPFVFWTAIIAIGTWASWVIVTNREDIPEEPESPVNEITDSIPPAIVDQPVLEEVSADGSVRWTLYLDRIVREEDSVMELAEPRALYRFESGEVLEVTGSTGTYDEEAHVLILSGDVNGTAREAEFEFTVDEMTWDGEAGMLVASGGVEIRRGGIVFNGFDLTLDMSEEFTKMEVGGGPSGVRITSTTEALEEIEGL